MGRRDRFQQFAAITAMEAMQQSSARYYQRPDADYLEYDSLLTNLSGHGGSIEIGKGANGRFRYSADLNWRSPGLELNDIGFLQMSDIIDQGVSVAYVENEPKSITFFHKKKRLFLASNYL